MPVWRGVQEKKSKSTVYETRKLSVLESLIDKQIGNLTYEHMTYVDIRIHMAVKRKADRKHLTIESANNPRLRRLTNKVIQTSHINHVHTKIHYMPNLSLSATSMTYQMDGTTVHARVATWSATCSILLARLGIITDCVCSWISEVSYVTVSNYNINHNY